MDGVESPECGDDLSVENRTLRLSPSSQRLAGVSITRSSIAHRGMPSEAPSDRCRGPAPPDFEGGRVELCLRVVGHFPRFLLCGVGTPAITCNGNFVYKAVSHPHFISQSFFYREMNQGKPVHPRGNQSSIFIGRIDAEAEAPVLRPPDTKSRFIR